MANINAFSLAQHAEIGSKLKQLSADIRELTGMIGETYGARSEMGYHSARNLDRARAALELVRTGLEDRAQVEYPHSFERSLYREVIK